MSMAAPASPIAADVQCAESGKPSNDSRRLMNRLDEIRAKREDGWHAGLTWDDTDYLLERIEALEKVAEAAWKVKLCVMTSTDISDYSDEWCAGFLQGQVNAALVAAGEAVTLARDVHALRRLSRA